MSDKIEVLTGAPPCPMCTAILKMRSMPDVGEGHWYCRCGTEWETPDLIVALNQIEELACVLATAEADRVKEPLEKQPSSDRSLSRWADIISGKYKDDEV